MYIAHTDNTNNLEMMYNDDDNQVDTDSDNSNREDRSENDYPDEDSGSEDYEEYATKQCSINPTLEEYLRKKSNYRDKQNLLERAKDAEERYFAEDEA